MTAKRAALVGLLFPLLAGAPYQALAGYCEDLWFTRNAILDRAGICFDSPLGQSVFDNTGCLGSQVSVAPAFSALVNQLGDREREVGCNVSTNTTFLDLKDLAIRQRLSALPLPEDRGQGFGCIGWRGGPVTLMDTHGVQGTPIGRIDPGDTIYFFHIPAQDWSYVTTEGPGRVGLKSGGWMPNAGFDSRTMCGQQAG
ncbi:DUF4453 domain-containing protein [Tropicimonas sp. S265A]|uniref:DUF4453 domain-containing protein n=1 Tax=Tropicimonas sp. S265A TaxID=3415134 RepID=UPI003C79FB2C